MHTHEEPYVTAAEITWGRKVPLFAMAGSTCKALSEVQAPGRGPPECCHRLLGGSIPGCENTCSPYSRKLKCQDARHLLECRSRRSEPTCRLCTAETLGQALLAPPRLRFTVVDRWLWFSFGDTLNVLLILPMNLLPDLPLICVCPCAHYRGGNLGTGSMACGHSPTSWGPPILQG